jgi:MFS family permease
MIHTVALLCIAEILTMTGVSTYAALLPVLRTEWHAANTLAGTISGAFFGGYMVAVPALASLTDRVPARRVYMVSCGVLSVGAVAFAFASRPIAAIAAQAVLGAGLAGTYMPGLKELSDRVGGPRQSRAIAFYTSAFGLGNSLSLWMAGALHAAYGWRAAFAAAAIGPLGAAGLIALALPAMPRAAPSATHDRLWARVLRVRRVRQYVFTYTAHCCELFALRSWMVAFLVHAVPGARVSAPTIAAGLNLLGPPASIGGNEIAAGRRVRFVRLTMAASAALAIATGLTANMRPAVAIAVLALYVVAIMADSAAMTAGLIEAAPPDARGTAMAVYSFAGFGGALAGPILFGALLDAGGGETAPRTWLLAFCGVAAIGLTGVAVLRGVEASEGRSPSEKTSYPAAPASDPRASRAAPAGSTPAAPSPPAPAGPS